jgi:UDP-N-acetyl-D-mannosaminuronic acid transferase (WecB/TagA/CpsF family)
VALPPKFVRVIGLEWLYRLVTQPRRRFLRQVRSLPVFLWHEILVPLLRRPFSGA